MTLPCKIPFYCYHLRPSNAWTASFRDIEENHPELVAIDSEGRITGQVMDFGESHDFSLDSLNL